MATSVPTTHEAAMMEAAVYALHESSNFALFPLHNPLPGDRCTCGDPQCSKPGKHPRTGHGFKDATHSAAVMRVWWGDDFPGANVGIATGRMSGIVVLDVDPAKGGLESLLALEARHGELPKTLTVATGGGGYHYYFRHPGDAIKVPCIVGKLSEPNAPAPYGGLDVRGDGGYVVAPPSMHASGVRYDWELLPATPAMEDLLEDLPGWLHDLIQASSSSAITQGSADVTQGEVAPELDGGDELKEAQFWLDKYLAEASEGNRNDIGFRLACQLRDNGVSENVARYNLQQYANMVPGDGYSVQEAIASCKSAYKGDKRAKAVSRTRLSSGASSKTGKATNRSNRVVDEQGDAPTGGTVVPFRPVAEGRLAPSSEESTQEQAGRTHDTQGTGAAWREHSTDMGNARRFVASFGHMVRYVHVWGAWLIWDGMRWRRDEVGAVADLAKRTVKSMWAEVGDIEDDDARKEFIKWIYRSEGAARLIALLEVAKSEPEIARHHSKFDSNPWLFNCLNGTLDLKSGMLRPHAQSDLITKLAPVEYRKGATLPLWDKFLRDTTGGEAQLRDFLQRAVGYTLTGVTDEEKLFFAHGPSRTGKSTFFEALKSALGDYAQTADFETFLARPQVGGIRNDIADLLGSRFVASVEVDDGKRLAQGLMKVLTGSDTIKARHLYKEAFSFVPTFKLWLAANDAPKVDASDGGMWNRILRIPFVHVPERRDPRVKATLRDPSKAGAAILAWAVEGCLRWQAEGLGVPELVQEATDAYRADMDPLKDWLADCCELEADAWTSAAAIRESYNNWCKVYGERFPLNGNKLAKALGDHGVTPKPKRLSDGVTQARGYVGLRITSTI